MRAIQLGPPNVYFAARKLQTQRRDDPNFLHIFAAFLDIHFDRRVFGFTNSQPELYNHETKRAERIHKFRWPHKSQTRSLIMNRRPNNAVKKIISIALWMFCALALQVNAQDTALDRYIAKPDPSYGWKLANTVSGQGYKGYILELSSQTWRSATEVDRPVWKHWLTIIKPDKATSNKALLFIGGGSNKDTVPAAVSERTLSFAMETNTVIAELGMVPNQPLFFSDSKEKGRSEDDLIAYSRIKQINTGDDEWLVRLAMVKSGVRALDAVQEFLASEAGGRLKIDQFVVSGGSKRGWTTWLVGAVDKRVIAIMPTVIDALNSEAITRHHFEAYGFFSPALNDYVNHKIFPDKIGTPEYQHILAD